jgi:hypothetical protein
VRRIRVIKVTQKVLFGNEKASTYVEVWDIDKDSGEIVDETRTRSVRARDIFMHWDEYADEYERKQVQKQKQMAEQAQAKAMEARAADATLAALVALGIPEGAITSIYTWEIRLDRRLVDQALGVNQLKAI